MYPSMYLEKCCTHGFRRIWNVENLKRQKEVIVLRGKGLAHRIAVTAATYSRTGTWLAGATHDGSLRFWNASGPYFRPTIEIVEAHQSGCGISSICFGPDDSLVASRGNDHTLKGRMDRRDGEWRNRLSKPNLLPSVPFYSMGFEEISNTIGYLYRFI